MPDGYDYLFKLLLIGDSGVGKRQASLLRADSLLTTTRCTNQ